MSPRRPRWRLQTIAALSAAGVIVVAVLSLVGTFFAYSALTRGDARTIATSEAEEVARSLADQAARGSLSLEAVRDQRRFFEDEYVAVTGPKGSYSVGSRPAGLFARKHVTVGATGITVESPLESESALPLELTGITAGVLLLVGLLATGAVWRGSGRLRHTIDRASEAARRLAAGDLTTRVGAGGTAEVADLGRAFDSMASRLAAAEAAQRRFLADLSHEIATPFHTVAGLAEALIDGIIDPGTADADLRATVRRETARMNQLLADLRESTDPNVSADLRRVDLTQLVKHLGETFAGLAANRGIGLRVSGDAVALRTDPRMVEVVVSNFLTNALRYTPSGGQVRVAVQRAGDQARVSVRDTGPGIPTEEQGRIFDRFYRLDEARDRAAGGSGLGLAIARRYADALGGWVEVESEAGHGATFSLLLPSTDAAQASRPAQPAAHR